MGKSITVKAETIEEAVRLALSIRELDIENVHIEVLSNPEKSLFGLRKTMGEKVTQRAIISPGNDLKVTVSDELIPPRFSIQLVEHDMLAMLVFTPGKKVKRTLPDIEFAQPVSQ